MKKSANGREGKYLAGDKGDVEWLEGWDFEKVPNRGPKEIDISYGPSLQRVIPLD
jgi:hypothetical protein